MIDFGDFVKNAALAGTSRALIDPATLDVILTSHGKSLLASPHRPPTLVMLGDSTFSYVNVTSPSATSIVYNGDGTATATFTIDQGLRAGDKIGIQGCVDGGYNVPVGKPLLSVTGSGPYQYTYAINPAQVPQTSPDTSNAVTMMFEHQKSAYTLVGNLRFLAGPQFRIISCGLGGNTSSDLVARFARDVAPLHPDEVAVTYGINDIYKGIPAATSQANLATLWAYCKAIGARMRLIAMPPQPSTRAGWTTATRDAAIALRKYMRIFARKRGIAFHDWSSVAAGSETAQNPTDANANPSTGMINTGDGVHPTNKLGYLLAKEIVTDLRSIYPIVGNTLPVNVTDGGLFSNPLFTGSGGTAPIAPVSGTIPDTCAVTVTAGSPSSVVCSQVARTVANDGDAAGNWFQIVFTAAAAGDQIRLALQDTHTAMANGNTYAFQLQARITAGATFCKEFRVDAVEQNNSSINITHQIQACTGTQAAPWPENFSGVFADDMTMRSSANVPGTITVFSPRVYVTAAAAGAITIQVARAALDLVTS